MGTVAKNTVYTWNCDRLILSIEVKFSVFPPSLLSLLSLALILLLINGLEITWLFLPVLFSRTAVSDALSVEEVVIDR